MKDKIITQIFNNIVIDNYCKSLDYNNWEDLKSELIMQLYKMNETKLIEHTKNNCLTYICFTIIKRIKFGTITDTGYFYGKNRFTDIEGIDIAEEEPETKHYATDELNSSVKNLHWYSKYLFELYYIEEMTLKEISMKTGINLKSIHYSIKKTRIELKKKLKK